MNPSNNQVEYPNIPDVPPLATENIWGMFQTVSAVPTNVPIRMVDQIQIYSNGATYKLYVYNTTTATWQSVTIA